MNELMEPSDISILYEDNHLLVVIKPYNLPTQEDESRDPDLLTMLKSYLKKKYNKPGDVFLGLVHRLDRPAGGVMVFAKTSKAASRLSEAIRMRAFDKVYLAVIHGTPTPLAGSLHHWLSKDPSSYDVSVVQPSVQGAKEAWLDYTVIKSMMTLRESKLHLSVPDDKLCIVRIQLHTGRSHQIRVQFAAIGHPLWGDQRYGTHVNRVGQQLALWSHEISFKHPTRFEQMQFRADPPQQLPWSQWMNLIRDFPQ